MKNIITIIGVLLVVSMSACDKGKSDSPPYPPGIKKSYIQRYLTTDTLTILERIGATIEENELNLTQASLTYHEENIGKIFGLEDNIMLFASLEWKEGFKDGFFDYTEVQGYDEKYAPMAGDTYYNAEPVFGLRSSPIAITDTLQSIEITTDRDFSPELPAGTNLNHLFKVYFEDPYLVIENEYRQPAGGYRLSGVNYSVFPHIITGGKLDEINFPEKPFIGNTYMCVLDQLPNEQGEYKFKIRIKKTNGNVIENVSRPILIQGTN